MGIRAVSRDNDVRAMGQGEAADAGGNARTSRPHRQAGIHPSAAATEKQSPGDKAPSTLFFQGPPRAWSPFLLFFLPFFAYRLLFPRLLENVQIFFVFLGWGDFFRCQQQGGGKQQPASSLRECVVAD